MLIITRRSGEKIMLDDDIVIEITGNQARIGIKAPRSVRVYREEIFEGIQRENREAAEAAPVQLPATLPVVSPPVTPPAA